MTDGPPPLDSGMLKELRSLEQGSPGLVAELIDVFLKQGGERLPEIRRLMAAQDGAPLARLVHTLKGSSGSMGALPLSGLCRQLEDDLRASDWAGARSRLDLIEAEYLRVRAALEIERGR